MTAFTRLRAQPADALISLIGFFTSVFIFPFSVTLFFLSKSFRITLAASCLYTLCLFPFSILLALPTFKSHRRYCNSLGNISLAFFLGVVFSTGITVTIISIQLPLMNLLFPFGLYVTLLAFFHWSEFYFAVLYNSSRATLDLYLLNHSPEYLCALVLAVIEHFVEGFLIAHFEWNHPLWIIRIVGFFLCLFGEILRKTSILTAANNFNHYIETTRRSDHSLVTHGVYAWSRHPAYAGWFYWAVGTQLLLCNPVCLLGYTIAAHRFFQHRIEYEERYLVRFFGSDYIRYQDTVGIGIPFIRGYQPPR